MSQQRARPYRAFLLRCWREGPAASGAGPAWRFSLEEVGPEKRRLGFGSLEALVAFLRAEVMGETPDDQTKIGDLS